MRIGGGLRFGVVVAAATGFAVQSYAFPSENYAAERVRGRFDDLRPTRRMLRRFFSRRVSSAIQRMVWHRCR